MTGLQGPGIFQIVGYIPPAALPVIGVCSRADPQIGSPLPVSAVVLRVKSRFPEIGNFIVLVPRRFQVFHQDCKICFCPAVISVRGGPCSDKMLQGGTGFHREGIGRNMGRVKGQGLIQGFLPLGGTTAGNSVHKVNGIIFKILLHGRQAFKGFIPGMGAVHPL